MMRQAFDLLGQSVGVERFHGVHDAGMQYPAPLLEQTAVGDLMREGVLEGVLALGKEPRLVEKLSRLKVCQPAMQRVLGQLSNGLEQGEGHFGANHGSGLEQALFLRW